MRKPLAFKLALSGAYLLIAIFLISVVNVNHAYSKQANVCDGLTGAAYGLCNAYCNAMKCGTDQQNASDNACGKVRNDFFKHSDLLYIPCDDPCQEDVSNNPENECPCDFSASNPTRDCWSDDELDFSTCPMAPLGTKNNCSPGPSVINYWCSFGSDIFGGDPGFLVAGFEDENNNQAWACNNIASSDSCGNLLLTQQLVTYTQAKTCICRLEQEVNELAQVPDIANAIVPMQSTPYTCAPPMINP